MGAHRGSRFVFRVSVSKDGFEPLVSIGFVDHESRTHFLTAPAHHPLPSSFPNRASVFVQVGFGNGLDHEILFVTEGDFNDVP